MLAGNYNGVLLAVPLDGPGESEDLYWQFDTGRMIDASPSVVNDMVFVGNEGGDLYAIKGFAVGCADTPSAATPA